MPNNPDVPPPLPPEVKSLTVTRANKTKTQAVSKRNAARLLGVTETVISRHIAEGAVDVCRHPKTNEHLVLIDSLWLLVPEERRV